MERRADNNRIWTYGTIFPGADFRQNQIGVQHPRLVESTGVDGRFLGAIRPFPGMADGTVHGIPAPETGVTTIESISNVVFAKYVSIQKGVTRHTIKGLVYLADNQDGDGKALYFAYRDSEDDSTDVIQLENFSGTNAWDDFTLDSLHEYDVTSMGKYIYFVSSGDTSSQIDDYNEKEPPYNKAYFRDWKINSWDKYVDGFDSRFMSIMPHRLLKTPINADTRDTLEEGSSGAVLAGDLVIRLTADSPDLSDVSVGDLLYLRGTDVSSGWSSEHTISAVDDGADTVTVSHAPQSCGADGTALASGTAGSTTDGSTTITLSGDTPDLSGVAANDIIKIAYATGVSEHRIVSVNDGADTIVVSIAPLKTEASLTWAIYEGDVVRWFIKEGTTTDSEDSFSFEPHGLDFTMPEGNYTGAAELISRKHNLRSYMRTRTEHLGTPTHQVGRYFIDEIKLPASGGGATNQIRGFATDATCILHWGIPHVDGFRFWRSPGDSIGSDNLFDKYTPVGVLYLVDEYKEKLTYDPDSSLFSMRFEHAPLDWVIGGFDGETTYYTDAGLTGQTPYDAWDEYFGPAPRMKRIAQYNGLLVGITDIAEPTSFTDWSQADQRTEELCWSHTGKLEPENFPEENRYPPEDPSEKFLNLEQAGDHLFGVTNSSVYQVTRAGSIISLSRVLSRLGGVSRFGATGIGNALFVVTKAGVKSIDGNTRAVQSISAMDRIIMDDGEWAQSLGSVFLEYDATLGVLVFLNTAEKECFLLWEATGAVTRVTDCPWSFLTGGNDVLTNGPQRAYFVTSDGVATCIDGAREMGKRTMCGTGAGETVGGTVTTGSSTQIIDSAATFPLNCVGHKVYVGTGNLTDKVGTITTRDSATTLTVSGLGSTTTIGDRYSVAPVVTELVFQQLGGENGIDPFSRKITQSMSAAFSDLGGETGSGDPNSKLIFQVWRNKQVQTSTEVGINILPDSCVGRLNAGDVRLYPGLKFLGSNLDWELQALMVHGVLSMSEAQSRQGTS